MVATNNLPSNFWSEAFCFQARRQRGALPPPIFVLAPTVFFWEEKVTVIGRKKEKFVI